MKLFISWSGPTSQKIAGALRTLVGDIFPDVVPWMSTHDIAAGTNWNMSLSTELGETNFGVLCLTSYNLRSPWLLFEAGSLAKHPNTSRVIPYLYGLGPGEVPSPLSLFQGVDSDKQGTKSLISAVNAARSTPYPQDKLDRAFEKWWPDFESTCQELWSMAFEEEVDARDRSMLPEILQVVQGIRYSVTELVRDPERDPIRKVFRIIEEVENLDPSVLDDKLLSAKVDADGDHPGAALAQWWLDVAESWLATGKSRHQIR